MVIDGVFVEKGLIVASPWIDLILSGKKKLEMRTTGTQIRGKVALIKKGSGCIVGLIDLVDSLPKMTLDQLIDSKHLHHVDYVAHPELLKWNTPWVLKNVRPIEPIPYNHKRGAVIWVNL